MKESADRIYSPQPKERNTEAERDIARTLEALKQKYLSVSPDPEYWRVMVGLSFAFLKCALYGGEKSAKLLTDATALLRYFEQTLVPRPPLVSFECGELIEKCYDTRGELAKDTEITLRELIEFIFRVGVKLFPELFTKKVDIIVLADEVYDYLRDEKNKSEIGELLEQSIHYKTRR